MSAVAMTNMSKIRPVSCVKIICPCQTLLLFVSYCLVLFSILFCFSLSFSGKFRDSCKGVLLRLPLSAFWPFNISQVLRKKASSMLWPVDVKGAFGILMVNKVKSLQFVLEMPLLKEISEA